jgi:hypothetical protein
MELSLMTVKKRKNVVHKANLLAKYPNARTRHAILAKKLSLKTEQKKNVGKKASLPAKFLNVITHLVRKSVTSLPALISVKSIAAQKDASVS